MSNLVKYGSYDVTTADEESKQVGSSDFLKLGVGKNRLRVLPPKVGQKSPFKITHVHVVEAPGVQYGIKFACLRLMFGKACPACIRSDQFARSGNPADRDLAYKIGAQVKVYANVIDRKEPERGPLVWEFGKKMHGFLKSLRTNEDAGGDFCDPIKGFDIIIERVGTGKTDTKYTPMASRNSSKLSESVAEMNEWIEGQRELERFVQVKSYEDIAKLVGLSGGQHVEADDAPPARGQRKPTAADDILEGEVVGEGE